MRFVAPHFFILVPLLVAVGWQWRALGLDRPLRAACLALVVLLLAGPQIERQGAGLDVWLLVDRSDSTAQTLAGRLTEWETILTTSKGADDRLIVVDFADEAVTRGAIQRAGARGAEYAGRTGATRLKSAALHALAGIRDDRASRLLALTDGYSTEPVDGLADTLRDRGVPLEVRFPPPPVGDDVAIAGIDMPRRIQPGEGMIVDVDIRGGPDTTLPVEIERDGEPLARLEARVVEGRARLRFTDRLQAPGSHRYAVRILPDSDIHPGNNVATRFVEVVGGPRILVVSGYEGSPLTAALVASGIEVEEVTDLSAVHLGMLSGAKGVILDNVPAHRLPPDFVKSLDFFVNEQGGGLAMIGGRFSFASGGWANSPVDPLLPVSMEMKQEHRKLAVAMVIVLDRSGSMAMTAPGTSVTKMSLADDGAARSIDLLGDGDFVAVIPVDSVAHPLSDGLVAVGRNRADLISATRRVTSGGGGIFCYTGLAAAWSMLRDAPVGQRHVILFADAADAEEQGEYKALLAEMTAANCTVSVIGLGSETDQDAAFLRDVAERGRGRVFFNSNASELPALFQMETTTIARSAFLEDPVAIQTTPGWYEIAATSLEWPATVDAYNLVYLRPGASQAAVAGDDYGSPLVAFWQRGAGRAATIAFPLGGERSEAIRASEGYGPLVGTLGRWLLGPGLPAGIGLRSTVDGSRVRFDLRYDDTWRERIAVSSPRLSVAEGKDGQAKEIPWERLAPGHFSAGVDLGASDFLRAAVSVGESALAAGPLDVTIDPESTFDPRRRDQVRRAAIASGGLERENLADIWSSPRPAAWRDLGRWLFPLLLACILLEALQTQTGWRRARQAPGVGIDPRTVNGR